jgi:septal ring factor EnvC (AmiA/AmiB activator)
MSIELETLVREHGERLSEVEKTASQANVIHENLHENHQRLEKTVSTTFEELRALGMGQTKALTSLARLEANIDAMVKNWNGGPGCWLACLEQSKQMTELKAISDKHAERIDRVNVKIIKIIGVATGIGLVLSPFIEKLFKHVWP